MTCWVVATLVLLIAGVLPAAIIGMRGPAVGRLVGLELLSSVCCVVLLLLAQADAEPMYLIVPLVLVVLSFAGTLVFTRLFVGQQ